MGINTGIEWTDATWNPWVGCHKVSPACAHCYMFRDQERYGQEPNIVRRTKDKTFLAPLGWAKSSKIFTCSWSDFFIEEADPWRAAAWAVMLATQRHTYQVLTKRPERLPMIDWPFVGMMPNVWTGVSVENARFYWRIDSLLRMDPRLAFLSVEPMLGPMPDLPLDGISWVIIGGESGANFRPLNLEWVRQVRDRCVAKGVPFFFKQHSAFNPKNEGRLLDGREWNEFPATSRGKEGKQ